MTVKNFGFAAHKPKGRGKPAEPDNIPFTLVKGGPELFVRGDANGDGLAVISAQFFRAEQNRNNMGIIGGLFDALEELFVPDTITAILAKIKDKNDPFGWDQLGEVIEWATEVISNRPTTSSRT